MSLVYVEKNTESTQELFKKRRYYLHDSKNAEYENLINFELAEKYLYGRVDRHFVPIYLNTDVMKLATIPGSPDPLVNYYAAGFVVDAFKDLSAQFNKARLKGKISSNEAYLSKLSVYKAYEEPIKLYSKHTRVYKQTLNGYFRQNKINFGNFDEFLHELKKSLQKTARRTPFTFPAYIKSKTCPMACTGLVIEIADINYENDEEKMNNFVNSRNWEYYLNACRSYGFSVDQTFPWRLVADIGSKEMIRYAVNHGLHSTSEILISGYKKAPLEYYSGFKQTLLDYYNFLKPDFYVETDYCQNGRAIQKKIYPIRYKMENLTYAYREADFLDFYFTIRFAEEETKYSEAEMEKIKRNALSIFRERGIVRALTMFERKINQTYDYSGSLTSYVKSAKLIEEEAMINIDEQDTTTGGGATATVSGY
jgi:hypothetical protein